MFTHTVMRRQPLIKSCAIYSYLDVRVENKAAALHVLLLLPPGIVIYFSQKGEEKRDCLNAKLDLECDPNS